MTMKLRWGEADADVATVLDFAELEKRLRDLIPLSKVQPIIVTVEWVPDQEISLAIAGSEAAITIFTDLNSDVRTEHFAIGNPDREGYTAFMLLGAHHTELPDTQLVPTDEALSAVREFIQTGRRSSALSWERNAF